MNKGEIIRKYEARKKKKETVPQFAVGDTVVVYYKIKEGDKERVQPFEGTVIRHYGRGIGASFTVRKIIAGEGVEKTFPLYSPNLVDVKVERRGDVCRARLYYLRQRVGKSTKVKEKAHTAETEESTISEHPNAEAAVEKEPVAKEK